MNHSVSLCFEYDQRRAHDVADALRVEVGEIADDRSAASVEREGRTVRVAVTAADLVALRAGTNTWLRLVDTAEAVTATAARYTGDGSRQN